MPINVYATMPKIRHLHIIHPPTPRADSKLNGKTSSLSSPLYPADMGYVNAGVDHVRNTTTQTYPTIRAHSNGGCFFAPSRLSPRTDRYAACAPSSSMMPSTCAQKYRNAPKDCGKVKPAAWIVRQWIMPEMKKVRKMLV